MHAGWLSTSRMTKEARQRQRIRTAIAVAVLEDMAVGEVPMGRAHVGILDQCLAAARAMGAAAMLQEQLSGLYVMQVTHPTHSEGDILHG